MPHQDIEVSDYHEGDSLEIPIIVQDQDGTRQDITGATVEWLLKDDKTDTDDQAVLHKDNDGNGGVEITTPTEGEATVTISTGDTDGLLDDDTLGRVEQKDFHHRARVTDSEGNRSTIFHGTFTIYV